MSRKLRSALLLTLALGTFATLAARQATRPADTEPPAEVLPVLQQPGPRYFKGNLHTHSFWSDGDDFPEMIADWYKRHGYQFLALSDHNILSQGQKWVDASPQGKNALALAKYQARFGDPWIEKRTDHGRPQVRLKPLAEFRSVLDEPGRFLLIQGEEITHRFSRLPVHMNAINLRDVILPIDGDSVQETIQVNHRLVTAQQKRIGRPILAFLNHPNFGWGIRAEDMIQAPEMRFFEIFNGHPSVRNYGDSDHPGCERLWDIVLALRLGKYHLPLVHGLATDDAHRYHQWGVGKVNPGRGWLMVRAPYLSAEAIVGAIERGDFYASTGVTLKDIRRTGNEFHLTIQPEAGVTYRTQFIATSTSAPLDASPRTGKDGKPLPVTGQYSPEIGKVVAEVEGTTPSYRLTGQELYVRAKVISSRAHPNPYQAGDVEVAWTQPIQP
jgi:hypothetical protein